MTCVFSPALSSSRHRMDWSPKCSRQSRQRRRFSAEVLIVHLLNHEGSPSGAKESEITHLETELRWTPAQASAAMTYATRHGLIERRGEHLALSRKAGAWRCRCLLDRFACLPSLGPVTHPGDGASGDGVLLRTSFSMAALVRSDGDNSNVFGAMHDERHRNQIVRGERHQHRR